jgi:hypothetical protein
VSHQKPTSPSDDEAPDAWLKGALLHAPDAQADAPPALTHNILRESRLALGSGLAVEGATRRKLQAPVRSHWLMAAWNHLTRPQVAAGFASVMVATLAGVLWWDKPLDEKGDPPMVAVAPSPQAAPVPASAAPVISSAADAGRAAEGLTQSLPNRRASPEVAQDKELSAPRAEALAKPAAESTARAKRADAPRLEESRRQAKRESTQADTVVAEAAAPTPTPAPAPAPAPAPLAPPSAAMPAPAAAVAVAPALTQAPELASAKVSRDESAAFASPPQSRSTAMQSAQRAAPAPAAVAAPAAAATGNVQTASVFSSLLAAVTTSPEQWRWQTDGSDPQAVTPALQSWLQLLNQSAGSRWVAGDSLGGPAVDSAALNLRLTTGTSSARIALAGNTVTLQRGGAPWKVALEPQAADALRKAWADKLR